MTPSWQTIGWFNFPDNSDCAEPFSDSGIVMVDGTFFSDSSEQHRSWDDSGTTFSRI